MCLAVKMPDLGMGPDDRLVVGYWLARVGEEVWEGQDLVEIVCREAAFNVPCPADGRLADIRLFADEPVRSGQVLGIVEPSEEPSFEDE